MVDTGIGPMVCDVCFGDGVDYSDVNLPAAASAASAALKAAWSLGGQSVARRASRAMWQDYKTLVELASARKWNDTSPVDPELLGPLWLVAGPQVVLSDSSDGPGLEMHELKAEFQPKMAFRLNPGSASPEEIAELLLAISELFRAVGGKGLVFEISGGQVLARQEVLS